MHAHIQGIHLYDEWGKRSQVESGWERRRTDAEVHGRPCQPQETR